MLNLNNSIFQLIAPILRLVEEMQLPKWLLRRSAKDTADDALGIRGAGTEAQANFGEPITEADLLFAVKREPLANRAVFQVAHDIFDKWFEVEVDFT